MTDHASHLCLRSEHQAIYYATALVSAVASAASFLFIGDRNKKSLAKNPTELGGAGRVCASMCKHRMVSAAIPEFP